MDGASLGGPARGVARAAFGRYHGPRREVGQSARQKSVSRELMKRTSRHVPIAVCILVVTTAILHAVSPSEVEDIRSRRDVNVRSYGARGDGKTDDTAAFVRAMRASLELHRALFVPTGVYRLARLTLPDGLTLKGAGRRTTWLKGHLDFGSNQVISDLKIGDAGNSAIYNREGATNTVFQRCRFRGGGGLQSGSAGPVVALGFRHNTSHITFTGGEVERNLGTETTPRYDNCFNDISVYSEGSAVPTDIVFDGVHVGVSNGQGGHDTGSPRMGLEAYTEDGAPGWQNITIRNSTFEAADAHTVDFSDEPGNRSTGVLVEGSLLKGGGYKKLTWGYTLNLEMPLGAVIRNNTIWRAWGETLYITDRGNAGYTGPAAIVTGNTFDLAYDNGMPATSNVPIHLLGDGNQFTGNTITLNYSDKLIDLEAAHNNIVTGNTAHIGGRVFAYQWGGSSGNTIAPNTVN